MVQWYSWTALDSTMNSCHHKAQLKYMSSMCQCSVRGGTLPYCIVLQIFKVLKWYSWLSNAHTDLEVLGSKQVSTPFCALKLIHNQFFSDLHQTNIWYILWITDWYGLFWQCYNTELIKFFLILICNFYRLGWLDFMSDTIRLP